MFSVLKASFFCRMCQTACYGFLFGVFLTVNAHDTCITLPWERFEYDDLHFFLVAVHTLIAIVGTSHDLTRHFEWPQLQVAM